ncbi:transcription termination factor Rho [Actinospongicola halichondriae]|uniref:transcription termination factor Rho n=1 Tax=Actinospongicola halichondriae TaxID=3236844 RepID=UPI003D3FCB4A
MSVEAERETLERKDRDELQKIAGALGGKVTSRTRKADIIEQILELTGVTDAGSDSSPAPESKPDDEPKAENKPQPKPEQRNGQQNDQNKPRNGGSAVQSDTDSGKKDSGKNDAGKKDNDKDASQTNGQNNGQNGQDQGGNDDGEGGRRRRRRGRNREGGPQQDEFTGEPIPVSGCLDLRDDGYGFLRVEGLLPSKDDCYVSVKQVRQFGLRKGDIVAGGSRPAFRNEKNPAILRIDSVNDVAVDESTVAERPLFEELAAVFATEALTLTVDGDAETTTTRALELLAPIGKGSRVLLAAPPRSGKTTMLQTLARSIEANESDTSLIVVLLDERPEEITEMQRFVAAGTVYGSAFDAEPEDHLALVDLALARARRMAEAGDDVVVLVDGLTRLARADQASPHGSQNGGRSLGGLDNSAIQAAKRAFGAGRNLEDAGSVTLVATVAVDTGAAVDEAVYEAVLGAATTQIRLDRSAAERRTFPAIDVGQTSTRREELLVGDDGASARDALRRVLAAQPDASSADNADGLDTLINRLRDMPSNDDVLGAVAKEEKSR